MDSVRYLIVGGGLAGTEAIRAIRDIDPNGTIALVGREPHLPYNRPPLSKAFLRGEKPEAQLPVVPRETFDKWNVKLILGQTVERIDPKKKSVALSGGDSMAYDKLLLATGGRPRMLDLPGANLPGVHVLRTVDDSKAIAEGARKGGKAVLIGGGFIGVEVSASLRHYGIDVTVLEKADSVLREIAEPRSADFIRHYCEGKGVHFHAGADIAGIEGPDRVRAVTLRDGTRYPCDFVVIAVGIQTSIELARDAGLALEGDGVRVDEHMRTSHPDIFAAGDIANYPDPIFSARRRVEHWGQAEYTGGLAGKNMAGRNEAYDLLTYIWSDIFDLHLEFSGWSHAADHTLLRGDPADGSFIVLYLKGNVLKAFLSVNAPKEEYRPLEKLIRDHVDLADHLDDLANRKIEVDKAVAQRV